MDKEIILAFDLSTTCTGVSAACVDGNKLVWLITSAIVPPNVSPADFGFLKSKRKVTDRKGNTFNAYLLRKDEIISKTEKLRRDRLVKKASEEKRIQGTIKEIMDTLTVIKPTAIVMETNMAFRSTDITRELAEISGALQALAINRGIPLTKINVHTARAKWEVYKGIKELAKSYTPKQLASMDLVKEFLKMKMLEKYSAYSLNPDMTTDESDSLILLDHFLSNLGLEGL